MKGSEQKNGPGTRKTRDRAKAKFPLPFAPGIRTPAVMVVTYRVTS